MRIESAILSVYDKEGIADFAKELSSLGVKIYSTGGTLRLLKESGVEVDSVETITQTPELLSGRVKTLHPKIFAGILAKRDDLQHMRQLEEHNIPLIDLVVCNLYPFRKVVSKKGVELSDALENIDIGGVTLIRAAAKNYRDVAVLVSPSQYTEISKLLKQKDRVLEESTLWNLAREAFGYITQYDDAISSFYNKFKDHLRFPHYISFAFEKAMSLRYGENPGDEACFYKENITGGLPFKIYQGKEISFNNLLDIDSALSIVKEFDQPACAIIKHTNPCGCGIGDSIVEAYKRAHLTDPISAFGGIVGLNRECDGETAQEIVSTFIEVVVSPGYSPSALEIFKKRKRLRVVEMKIDEEIDYDIRRIRGGVLIQYPGSGSQSTETWRVVTDRAPTQRELEALGFAWKVVKHVKSNGVVLAIPDRTIGIGAGQMARVDAVELAIMKAKGMGAYTSGTALASDGFFPFRDSIDKADQAGVTAVVQPGGSIRDKEVIDACNEHGMTMLFTDERCFRH